MGGSGELCPAALGADRWDPLNAQHGSSPPGAAPSFVGHGRLRVSHGKDKVTPGCDDGDTAELLGHPQSAREFWESQGEEIRCVV